jgi:copper resistance protein C
MRRAVVAVLVTILTVAAFPAPARAGGGLVSASPPDGTALTMAPAAVELTFTAPPDLAASHVGVWDAARTPLATGEPGRSGPDGLRQPLTAKASGVVTVAYHVVFVDGTDVVGVLRFSVGTGTPPPPLDPAARRADVAAVTTHQHDVDPVGASLLVVDAVVLLGAVILLFRRPAPRHGASGGE